MSNQKHNYYKLLSRCWITFAVLIIIWASLFSLFRALTPWARQYKSDVEKHLSLILGQKVTINSMETSWYWFEPVLKFDQITIANPQKQGIQLQQLLVGVNILSSLWHWQIQPGVLYIDRVKLSIRQEGNQWQVEGLAAGKQFNSADIDAYKPMLAWLLTQQKIRIRNVSALIYPKDGQVLPLENVNLTILNHSGHYRVKGGARLAQSQATQLTLLADVNLDPLEINKASGSIYLGLTDFLPAQWQNLFPNSAISLQGGDGDIQFWIELKHGQVALIQSKAALTHLAWSMESQRKSYFIPAVSANLAWKPTEAGWQVSADQIRLHIAGKDWPENQCLVDYYRSQKAYRIYVDKILLDSDLMNSLVWPEPVQSWLALHPFGALNHTQLLIQEGRVNYLLTKFDKLGWKGHEKIPGMSELTGVLYWQPQEGQLELDAQNALLTPAHLKPIPITELNGAISWKALSHGWRIDIPRLVMVRPDLILNVRGVFDDFRSENHQDQLQLNIEFSAENAQQWLTYLPSSYLKPKLDHWLKQDVKTIKKINGKILVDGALADFPFDKSEGKFSIQAHLNGVDLKFNSQWPLTQSIDGYLQFDKRTLEADIVHADLQGVELDEANLRISDIGLDRETLLIHAKTTAPAENALEYVLNSPLQTKLAKLNQMQIRRPIGVDLYLEIPLYPQNNHILALGQIGFADNQLVVKHSMSDIELQSIKGDLHFNEQGILPSQLSALLFDEPVILHLASFKEPEPYTQVSIVGNTSIDLLQKKFSIPMLSMLKGYLPIEARLKLTDDPNDLDQIQILTNLKAVAIDLPAPLGKPFEEDAPLDVTVGFNPEKAIRVVFNYADKIGGDLWFGLLKSHFSLQKGEIRFGSGHVVEPKQEGVQLVGELETFNLADWQKALNQLPNDSSGPSLFDAVSFLDLRIGILTIFQQSFQNVAIKANKLNSNEWSFYLKLANIAGYLRYQIKEHLLSGDLDYLYLEKASFAKKEEETDRAFSFRPEQIPNLNLAIDELRLEKINIGKVSIKSTSRPSYYHLDSCLIESPAYNVSLEGDWRVKAGKHQTYLQGEVQIHHLEHALKEWNIPEVVEAKQGAVYFKGEWPEPIYQFPLSKITGQMSISLKHGRITHLSPDTEEKLALGKLLSVLSLQTIPRRLQLDFSDLSKTGYSFDLFKGDFVLKNGVMHTDNSYIDGPVAYASMKGDLDVVQHLYDLTLHISPHITASLPVVATIAGGPVAGIATWVASKIVSQGMQKISGYTYKITGPWLNPVVQQVSITKKKAEKTHVDKVN